ncbi:tetratricopeptide repeat protein [Arenibaculum pallidiluteum]|uniref:tetratricopeptide repeat protein n=1 Tax=Arenibaculum pallidiluteum TaxID=2812559 RepID=UPI001A95DB5C|nr:hypothetical protein [Arenibaculum pallidiluteum]
MAATRIPSFETRDGFGPVPPHVDDRLSWALEAWLDRDYARCEALLWDAHRLGPGVPAPLFELCRFYQRQGELAEAERVAWIGLAAAERTAGLSADWRDLSVADIGAAARPISQFALVMLKALAEIRLRRGAYAEAGAMLERLEELDPSDTVGHRAVSSLFGWPEG